MIQSNTVTKKKRSSALGVAIEYGYVDFVKKLIEKGADLEIRTGPQIPDNCWFDVFEIFPDEVLKEINSTPLYMAVMQFRPSRDNDITSPSVSKEDKMIILDMLIEAGINLDSQNMNGFTALLAGSELRNYDVVKKLLEAGANVNITNNQGLTALDLCEQYGYQEIYELLSKYRLMS